jgi:hypothetical protein
MPPQADFLFRTWAKEAKEDPSLASQQPYKAIRRERSRLERASMI